MTGQAGNDGTKDVQITAPLKYLSNFWRALEIRLINSEINIFFNLSDEFIIVTGNYGHKKLQDNSKLLQQLKTVFKRTINWNKYQSEPALQTRNWYLNLNYLTDRSFQGVNRLSVLSFENGEHGRSYQRYFLPSVEIKDCNVMTDGKNIDQPVKNDLITYKDIQKIATGQGDDYYFKNSYKMIDIYLSKQQVCHADLKVMQKINFTLNIDWAGQTGMYFIIE